MAHPEQNPTQILVSLRTMVLAILATALCCSTAYAQTIIFTYDANCNPGDPGCPYSLVVATQVGQTAGDNITIASVNSDASSNSSPIRGGVFQFRSSPATQVQCQSAKGDAYDCYAQYGSPGGSAAVTGSVFGLPSGSTLLSASFLGGAYSEVGQDELGYVRVNFEGWINVSYLNPVLLANLGMDGLPNSGIGWVYDEFYHDGMTGHETRTVEVTFTSANTRVLHSFSGGNDGAVPAAGLTMDKAGNLYGGATGGGTAGGTVFQLKRTGSNWIFKPIYSFQGGTDGVYPSAKVILGPDGILYGTTEEGGDKNSCNGYGCGTVFGLKPGPRACITALCPWTKMVLYPFKGGTDAASPWGPLTFDRAGNMYGTSGSGGQNGLGTVFQLTFTGSSWTENVLYSFTGTGGEGIYPRSGVVFDPAGNLYGTTSYGGDPSCNYGSGCGSVFQLTPSGSGWTSNVLHTFNSNEGQPSGALICDHAGNLYGTASNVIFTLTPSGGTWTYVVLEPWGAIGISMDKAGSLYAAGGGFYGVGNIFKLTPSGGSWRLSLLADFTGGADGKYPYGDFVFDAAGDMFGTTSQGGNNDYGVVFELPHR